VANEGTTEFRRARSGDSSRNICRLGNDGVNASGRTSNWATHTFSGTATVNAGPGLAIAVVGPQVSVSTAAVP